MENILNIKLSKKFIIGFIIFCLSLIIWHYEINKGLVKENVITEQAGILNDSRSDHQVVLLNDGRIYIVGGDKTNKSAEIYDPKTKKSTRVKSMPKSLWNREYTVTALNNGKVLIAGGRESSGNDLKIAWIFDPVKNKYLSTEIMNDYHHDHTATLLNNGKVLIVGYTAEIYDITKNIFTYIKELNITGRHGAILLNDGRVLFVGGGERHKHLKNKKLTTDSDYSNKSEIYDPKKNIFFLTANMSVNRGYPVLTLLKNGEVLISGGWSLKDGRIQKLELYNPQKGTFTPAGNIDEREGFTATLLTNGKVLFAGGVAGYGTSTFGLASMYIYDPNTKSYKFIGNMRRKRAGHTATLLRDGSILFIGGTGYKDVEIFKLNIN